MLGVPVVLAVAILCLAVVVIRVGPSFAPSGFCGTAVIVWTIEEEALPAVCVGAAATSSRTPCTVGRHVCWKFLSIPSTGIAVLRHLAGDPLAREMRAGLAIEIGYF